MHTELFHLTVLFLSYFSQVPKVNLLRIVAMEWASYTAWLQCQSTERKIIHWPHNSLDWTSVVSGDGASLRLVDRLYWCSCGGKSMKR